MYITSPKAVIESVGIFTQKGRGVWGEEESNAAPHQGALMSPIAVTPVADHGEHRAMFAQRQAKLMEMAKNLAELSGVPVAVVCSGVDGVGDEGWWLSKECVREFCQLPDKDRELLNHADCVAGLRGEQSAKLDDVREGGISAAPGAWERAVEGLPEGTLRALLRSTSSDSLVATQCRIRELQPQHDESVAENFVTGEDASDRVQWLQHRLGKAVAVDDDYDEAQWMWQLVEDLKEKPKPANANAAPHNAYEYDYEFTRYIIVGGYVMERDAYDFIRHELGMPPPILGPESPEYGEPLQLWSWGNDSSPQSTPPPRKQARRC